MSTHPFSFRFSPHREDRSTLGRAPCARRRVPIDPWFHRPHCDVKTSSRVLWVLSLSLSSVSFHAHKFSVWTWSKRKTFVSFHAQKFSVWTKSNLFMFFFPRLCFWGHSQEMIETFQKHFFFFKGEFCACRDAWVQSAAQTNGALVLPLSQLLISAKVQVVLARSSYSPQT